MININKFKVFNARQKNYRLLKTRSYIKKNPIFLETGFGIGTGALQALECGFSK